MNSIRLGLIGAGWAARKYLEIIRTLDDIKAVGITSRTKPKAEQIAKEFEVDVCTGTIKSLIENNKLDALMVLVSEDQSCAVGQEVIPYGLPVYFEKPAGLTAEEGLKLARLARKYSVRTMVGYNRRYYSIFHKGLQIIREHGPLLAVAIEGHERMWRIREGRHFSEYVMEQWIFANSTHTIDLLRFFGTEVRNVHSISHSYKEKRGDQFSAIMELECGAIGQYNAFWYSPDGWSVKLYGDGVTVEFKPLEMGRWIDKNFVSHEIKPDEADVRFKPGFYKQVSAFGNLVRNGVQEWPMLDLEGAYKTMLLAEQLSSGLSDRSDKKKADDEKD